MLRTAIQVQSASSKEVGYSEVLKDHFRKHDLESADLGPSSFGVLSKVVEYDVPRMSRSRSFSYLLGRYNRW